MSYGDIKIESNSKFLKVETGTPHDIRLLDESPTVKMLHGFGAEAVECQGNGCLLCQSPDPKDLVKQRFSTTVYDHTLHRKMQWDFGAMVAKQLKAIDTSLKEEDKTILDVDLKVEATGSGMNKKYSVTPRMTAKKLPDDMIPF